MFQELTSLFAKTLARHEKRWCMLLGILPGQILCSLYQVKQRYMDTKELLEAVCLQAHCENDKEGLKTAIRILIDEAYTREITPSFIDFHLTIDNELAVTLYGY